MVGCLTFFYFVLALCSVFVQARLLETQISNSAYHGASMDKSHITLELEVGEIGAPAFVTHFITHDTMGVTPFLLRLLTGKKKAKAWTNVLDTCGATSSNTVIDGVTTMLGGVAPAFFFFFQRSKSATSSIVAHALKRADLMFCVACPRLIHANPHHPSPRASLVSLFRTVSTFLG